MSDESGSVGAPDDAVAAAKRALAEWPKTVKLGSPIEFGKETILELVFPAGHFGILKGMNIPSDRMPNFDELMVIASRLCGRPLKVIEMLDPDDAGEVASVATIFFSRFHRAGKRL